jgi:hypothetical protein
MRVELQIEGGMAYFPGLTKPVVVDSGDLSKAGRQASAADRFGALLRAAGGISFATEGRGRHAPLHDQG